ncbi:hypothetical protein AB0J55_22425 [Amycolatopsis sp. NPDC049688]|uniref:hypothetical protein n=1 Tax=Amycolatopsis sp. NPDC049688 TaxID=3154733 RepID=UPI003441ECCF
MTEGESGNPRRRSRKAVRLLLLSALVYLAGVGIGALLRRPDPWSQGIVALGPFLGAAFAKLLFGRPRRDGPS